MQVRSYNSELKIANIMFSSLFRTFRITRSDDSENRKGKTIDVPVVMADRSRIFKALENKLAESPLTLPLITIQRTGISIVPARLSNLHNEIKNQEQAGRINYNLLTPTPLDISYSVVFVSRFMNDIDLMIGQIIPLFNQDVYVSHRHPKYYNVKYNAQVVMGTDIQIESNPEIGKDTDEIHTATITFTYKTHMFGGTDQKKLGVINPYVPPVTKIDAEVHMVPYLESDYQDVNKNNTGKLSGAQDLSAIQEATIDNYFDKLDASQIQYPEYEQIDWIMDYQWNEETGEYELPYDPNKPYGYTPEANDGLTYVIPKHRLYDQLAEVDTDNANPIQSQNYHSQYGMPYREVETRPWNDVGSIPEITEEDLQAENPDGVSDYTSY